VGKTLVIGALMILKRNSLEQFTETKHQWKYISCELFL